MKQLLISLFVCSSLYCQVNSPVFVVGAMKNVMWKGQLEGNIYLDTIGNKINLYGLGPVEGLKGELLVLNGKAYKSVVSAGRIKVTETFDVGAPFFVYANQDEWKEYPLPDNVSNLDSLEKYLLEIAETETPFVFRLKGIVKSASIHVMNVPEGTKVTSPDAAHRSKVSYNLENTDSEMVGFFSKNHQSIFTHHDTFMHLHLITADHTQMGHLDGVEFQQGEVLLFLPK